MSEPDCGTDVLAMKTTAKPDGDGFRLNGSKMWITNGCVNDTDLGDVFLVYARTAEGSGAGKHSLLLVEKTMDGFSLGQRLKDKLGMRASATAELVFEDVYVPKENVVGGLGDAVPCMMRNLEVGAFSNRLCGGVDVMLRLDTPRVVVVVLLLLLLLSHSRTRRSTLSGAFFRCTTWTVVGRWTRRSWHSC